MLAEPLGKLTALQQLNLSGTVFGCISAKGAAILAEPLGKLTALQQLNLSGMVSFFGKDLRMLLCGILRCKMPMCLAFFLSRLAGNNINNAGIGMLAESLGKLTGLLQLDLTCKFSGIFMEGV